MPPYSAVFAVQGYWAIFLAQCLSTWGDYIARLVIAAVVYERTQSPLATATTLVVSTIPSVFGRTLLGPLADRMPYKHVLVGTHLGRALCVLVLMWLVAVQAPVTALFAGVFVLELVGGPAVGANQVLLTDFFTDRRVFVRAMGLGALSEQINQAVGLAVGGIVVAALGPIRGLVIDLVTFLVCAVVVAWVVPVRSVQGQPTNGLLGFFRDLGAGASHIGRHPVLRRLLALTVVSSLAVAAPEAAGIPYAGEPGLGGLLMAAPIAGAGVGIIIIGRWQPATANARLVPMALCLPVPLLFTALAPPPAVTFALWFVSGLFQAFMLPLQATFSLVAPADRRATAFALASAGSVGAMAVAYLVAGWFSQVANPAAAVAMCGVITLGATILLAARWPHDTVRAAVDVAYDGPEAEPR